MDLDREQVKPLNSEEKRLINNEAYADRVVYDAEKEAYVLTRDDEEKLRAESDEVTQDDLRVFEKLAALHKKNLLRARIKTVVAVILLVLAAAGPLFMLLGKAGTARVARVEGLSQQRDGGWAGRAVYEYLIGETRYTGSYRFGTKLAEYVPKEGDTVRVYVNYLIPSWSCEEHWCIPGVLNAALLLAAGFILYDAISARRDNREIRKYFDRKNMVWN
ncbi:MAG: hypothetical protein KIG36_05365 [Eubacteriales bacterium]|nr:hypothetical protein [Eubacteriales bacterium]